MDLNITCSMIPEEIFQTAYNTIAVPTTIIYAVVSFLIFLIVGLFVFDTSSGKKKFFFSWFISSAFLIIFLFIIIKSPFTILNIVDWFKSIFF